MEKAFSELKLPEIPNSPLPSLDSLGEPSAPPRPLTPPSAGGHGRPGVTSSRPPPGKPQPGSLTQQEIQVLK